MERRVLILEEYGIWSIEFVSDNIRDFKQSFAKVKKFKFNNRNKYECKYCYIAMNNWNLGRIKTPKILKEEDCCSSR